MKTVTITITRTVSQMAATSFKVSDGRAESIMLALYTNRLDLWAAEQLGRRGAQFIDVGIPTDAYITIAVEETAPTNSQEPPNGD